MTRGQAVPLHLGLLVLLVLPSTGLGSFPPGLSTPGAFLTAALLLTGFLVLVVGPWLGRARPGRAPALVVAALPFLAYGVLQTSVLEGTVLVPGIGLAIVMVLALAVSFAMARARRRVATAVVAVSLFVFAADAFVASAGADLLPRGWNPFSTPTTWFGPTPGQVLDVPPARPTREGLRVGAPVLDEQMASALGVGPGPWLVPAVVGQHGRRDRLFAVLGAGESPDIREEGVGTFLARVDLSFASPLELDPYDAILVLGETLPGAGSGAREMAEGLVTYARRGGLLVGPREGRSWPEPLGRELGRAGRMPGEGMDSARPLGLGLVVRAGSGAAVRDILLADAERARPRTVFDAKTTSVVPLPRALERWGDRPDTRRAQGLLLIVYALIAAALDWILRGSWPRFMGLVAPALAVCLGLAWTAPVETGVRVHGVTLEIGGGGGRRVDALALSAGPQGWLGTVRWQGGGAVRLLGARLGEDGTVRIRPGRTAWAVRESVARGAGVLEQPDAQARFLAGFLRGAPASDGARFGRAGRLPVRVGGRPAPETSWALELK